MIIAELLKGLEVKDHKGSLDIDIKGIAYDSRSVEEGFIFVAREGLSVNGHDFIKDAVSRGAVALLTERPISDLEIPDSSALLRDVTYIEVSDSRSALASIAARYYGEPSKELSLVGITGTNGKTTTSYITKSILKAAGMRAGLLGTVQYITGETREAGRTTPESSDLQKYLREMLDSGMEYAVLEVSSHALALNRVDGCAFKVAAFTNFSQDHLDFHDSMDAYFEAKDSIFSYLKEGGSAVLNWDDPAVREVEERLGCSVVTCGLLEGAMIKAENINVEDGLSFDLNMPHGSFSVESQFAGRFNVYNILISAGIAYAFGINDEAIKQGIREAKPVKGRFESIDEGQNFLCILDYAHTDDALRTVIGEARMITGGRVITLFGCGGDRDRTKRALMGTVASELSDIVIVTSDNPRNEDPLQIIEDILKGISKENYITEPDRAAAIREAVSMTKKGDTFLIAGKGHEEYQEIGGVKHPFSDNEIVRKAIKEIN
jgi:UDP-N-acetylmuramoyl-L-alanyl-D-glutamate--2,6-diaminopimelate ligase